MHSSHLEDVDAVVLADVGYVDGVRVRVASHRLGNDPVAAKVQPSQQLKRNPEKNPRTIGRYVSSFSVAFAS
jgi:hypothetical protein